MKMEPGSTAVAPLLMQKASGYSKMVGTHLNRLKNHEETIRAWMNTVVAKNGSVDHYDDLHIDQIDATWKARALWVPAALESFEHAVRIRDADRSNLSVVLAFSLESEEYARGLDFKNLEELEKEFHVTPPSLYLFRAGTEFWTQTAEYVDIKDVDWAPIFSNNEFIKRCVYM